MPLVPWSVGCAVWVPNYSTSSPFVEATVVEIHDTSRSIKPLRKRAHQPKAREPLRPGAVLGRLTSWTTLVKPKPKTLPSNGLQPTCQKESLSLFIIGLTKHIVPLSFLSPSLSRLRPWTTSHCKSAMHVSMLYA